MNYFFLYVYFFLDLADALANPIAYQSMVEKHADQLKALTDDIEVFKIFGFVGTYKKIFNNSYEIEIHIIIYCRMHR